MAAGSRVRRPRRWPRCRRRTRTLRRGRGARARSRRSPGGLADPRRRVHHGLEDVVDGSMPASAAPTRGRCSCTAGSRIAQGGRGDHRLVGVQASPVAVGERMDLDVAAEDLLSSRSSVPRNSASVMRPPRARTAGCGRRARRAQRCPMARGGTPWSSWTSAKASSSGVVRTPPKSRDDRADHAASRGAARRSGRRRSRPSCASGRTRSPAAGAPRSSVEPHSASPAPGAPSSSTCHSSSPAQVAARRRRRSSRVGRRRWSPGPWAPSTPPATPRRRGRRRPPGGPR